MLFLLIVNAKAFKFTLLCLLARTSRPTTCQTKLINMFTVYFINPLHALYNKSIAVKTSGFVNIRPCPLDVFIQSIKRFCKLMFKMPSE